MFFRLQCNTKLFFECVVMPEELLNNAEPKFRQDLEQLSSKWASLDDKQQLVEITCLFEVVRSQGFSEEQFYSEVAGFFDRNAQTIIHLWIDSFIAHGPKILNPEFTLPADKPDPIPIVPAQPTPAEKPKAVPLPDQIDEVPKQRPSPIQPIRKKPAIKKKPKKKKKSEQRLSIHFILRSKTSRDFSKEDAVFSYKNISTEWASLSQAERALILKELFNFESFSARDQEQALTKLIFKCPFLSKEQLIGYLEIARRPDTLRWYASKNFLDDNSVSIIGSLRSEFGCLFDINELEDKFRIAARKKDSLTESGHFKTDLFQETRQKLQEAMNGLKHLQVGETYVINPDSSLKNDYQGYFECKFKFVPQDSRELADYMDLRKDPTQIFFRGDEGQIYIIDFRAVCRLSDIKPEQED